MAVTVEPSDAQEFCNRFNVAAAGTVADGVMVVSSQPAKPTDMAADLLLRLADVVADILATLSITGILDDLNCPDSTNSLCASRVELRYLAAKLRGEA